MNISTKTAANSEDLKINVKLKLSALWVAFMFLYIYADILSLFQPGTVEELRTGSLEGIQFTQELLFGAAILVTIPGVMVFLSLALKPRANRWANIILGLAYTGVNIANLLSFDDPWAFIIFFHIAECVIALLIARYAWQWPQLER